MRAPSLSGRDLDELADFELGFERDTPLFYYVLKEAELVEYGLRLGPVGGRIVGEVILGLLELDPASYLSVDRRWRPTLANRDGDFRMVDFLTGLAAALVDRLRPVDDRGHGEARQVDVAAAAFLDDIPDEMTFPTKALQLPSEEVGKPEKLQVQPGLQLQNS